MSIRSALSFAPLLSSFASARPALDLFARQTTTTCATGVHVIAASGDGAANIGGYGLLGSLADSVVAAIPGSDEVTLPYPKDDPSGLTKVTVGGQNMVQYITDYAASCPNTKIVLMGYSAGGIIALNALCGSSPPWTSPAGPLDPSLLPNIVGVVIYGEEAHAAVSPFNAGTCTGNGRFPRAGASAACPASASKIRSYANAEDPQSCNGFVPDEHFAYPADYDQEATAFIVDLYNQNPSGPGSSASSSVVTSTVIPTSAITSTVAPSSVVISTVDSSSVVVSTVEPSVVVSTVAPSIAVSTVAPSVIATSVPSPSSVAAPSSEASSQPPLQTYITTALSATSAPASVATSAPVQVSSQAASSQAVSSQAASSQAASSQATSSQAGSVPAVTSVATPAPTSAPTGGSGNGPDGSPSTPSPEVPQATITAPEPETTSCPSDLNGDFEFPHLIVPVDESQPDLAPGTSYNGKVSKTVSSIFNFDIRPEYAGKTCSLIFTLPELAKLQYSSYTTSGTGGINIAQLESPADLQTSYANAPAEKTDLGTFAILPGGAHAFSTFPCPSGQRIGYKMSATGDYALDYFQASGEPIGLYIRAC